MGLAEFRVWYKFRKDYLKTLNIQSLLTPAGQLLELGEFGDIEDQFDESDVVIEFSSDLPDNNGDKIFDGDVLKDIDEEDYGYVFFEEGKFLAQFDNIILDLEEVNSTCIVAGNVHQHKYLIEGAE